MQDEQATSSVATTEAPVEDIGKLSPAERDSWRLTGKFPAEKAVSATADDKGKPADDGAKKTPDGQKAQATSEVAKNTQEDDEPKPESKAGKRIQQLIAKNKDLERQLEAAKPKEVAEAKPAAADTKEKLRAEPMPDDKNKDGSQKYKTYEEYNADRIEWGVEKALQARDAKVVKETKDAEVEKQNKAIEESWRSRVEKARGTHKDFDAVALNKDLPVKAGSVVDSFILDSDVGTEILYYLGANPAELDKINAMPGWKQARALMKIELDVEAKAAKGAAPVTPEKTEKPEAEAVQSRAPKPIREVGGRGGSPPDEEAAAVEKQDFSSFRSAANSREMSLRKGR